MLASGTVNIVIGMVAKKYSEIMRKHLVINPLQGVVVLDEQMSNFFIPDVKLLGGKMITPTDMNKRLQNIRKKRK